jgi:hypothetical protein
MRLSALRAGRPLPPGRFLALLSVRGWVNYRAIVRLEGLDQLKNPMSLSGIEPSTIRLIIQNLFHFGEESAVQHAIALHTSIDRTAVNPSGIRGKQTVATWRYQRKLWRLSRKVSGSSIERGHSYSEYLRVLLFSLFIQIQGQHLD